MLALRNKLRYTEDIKLKCECGKKFKQNHPTQKHCCKGCKQRAYRKRKSETKKESGTL